MAWYKLFRTSNFRLTLAASLSVCMMLALLFYIVTWSMSAMMLRHVDKAISNETKEILGNNRIKDLAQLIKNVSDLSAGSPEFFYLLQDEQGHRLAGNMPAIDPIHGTREWLGQHLTLRGKVLCIRGLGTQTINNSHLFVGLPSPKMSAAYKTVKLTFAWMTVGSFLALFLGGIFMSNRLLAHVESISQTSRDIISGDLKSRVPRRGQNDEFDHLASSVNTMLDRIQGLMEEVRQVSNNIAHDLRTPLTRLRQRLELAGVEMLTTEELHEVVSQSVSDLDHILLIFSSLLRIAQIESRSCGIAFKQVELSRLLQKIAELFRPAIEDKFQTMEVDIKDHLVIDGDEEMLGQLFVNLLDNATRHTPRGCDLTIKAYGTDQLICVEVADSGHSIPDAFKEKVLTPFFRLDQSRSTPGHGLGLSLVAAIASLHEAQLELLNNNPGLKVRLTFQTPNKA